MCTLLAASQEATQDGTAWIASTSDNGYAEGPRKPMVLSRAKNGQKILHTPCLKRCQDGQFENRGSDRGMNEAGFAWTRAWVAPSDVPHPKAMRATDWFLALAERCQRVSDVLPFLADEPRGFGAQGNFLFADAKGELVCIEVSYQHFEVIRADAQGFCLARGNRFQSKAMQGLDDSAHQNPIYFETTWHRERRAEALLKTHFGHLNLVIWQAILRDTKGAFLPPVTEHGASLCSFGRTHGTVSAEIFHPQTRSFYYHYGWPHTSFSKEQPPNLPHPNLDAWGQWQRFCLDELEEEGDYTDWYGRKTDLFLRKYG